MAIRILSERMAYFLERNLQVSCVILVVVLVRFLLRKCPRKYSYMLWSIVGIRMLFDLRIQTVFSVFNMFSRAAQAPAIGNPFAGGWSQRFAQGVASGSEQARNVPVQVGEMLGQPGGYPILPAGDIPTGGATAAMGAASATAPLTSLQRILGIAAIVWIVGMAGLVGYGISSYIRSRKMVAFAIRMQDNVYECENLPSPFVMGLFAPRIYIPFHMEEPELSYILRHERCHIRRRDPFVKLIAFVLLVVYWCNPLVWVAFFLLEQDMEMSCDEAVLGQLGSGIKQAYSTSLLSFATGRRQLNMGPLAFGEGNASKRIRHILNFREPKVWVSALCILLLLIVVPVCLTNAKTKREEVPEEAEETEDIADAVTTEQVEKWARAFSVRDGETIAAMCADTSVLDKFESEDWLVQGDGYVTVGWSSPWPWDAETDHRIVNVTANSAEIYYYGWVSDPHAYCMTQTIYFDRSDEGLLISDDVFHFYAEIATGQEFEEAYRYGINGTPMDCLAYVIDGEGKESAGDYLNQHTVRGDDTFYQTFLDPESALRYLLNLSEDPGKVQIDWIAEESGEGVRGAEITFTADQRTVYVRMIQPYGADGIWIPQDDLPGENTLRPYERRNVEAPLEAEEESEATLEPYEREGYQEAALTYVEPQQLGMNWENDEDFWTGERLEEYAQRAIRELYNLTGYQVENAYYTVSGEHGLFFFGKTADDLKHSRDFYTRSFLNEFYEQGIGSMSIANARRVWYSDVQQLDDPYEDPENDGHGALPVWFVTHSGVYRGEEIVGFDTVPDEYADIVRVITRDGSFYEVTMDEEIHTVSDIAGPYPKGFEH